eukprot:2973644-Pyramimonas_sp.AAC.1
MVSEGLIGGGWDEAPIGQLPVIMAPGRLLGSSSWWGMPCLLRNVRQAGNGAAVGSLSESSVNLAREVIRAELQVDDRRRRPQRAA